MQALFVAVIAAAFSAAVAQPALAAWERTGSVSFDSRLERETQFGGFGYNVNGVQLYAVGSDIACRTVRARFGGGNTREVWSGTLRVGRATAIDLPRNAGPLRGLEFICMAKNGSGRIDIMADNDGRGSGWRPEPGGPGPGAYPGRPDDQAGWDRNNWVALGTARFGNREGETTVDGAYGRHIRQIGIRAAGGDASCRAMVIRYTNGERQVLDVNGRGVMREGRLYRVDLPGNRRNVLRLALACQSVRAPAVSIQVYANK
ncbi:MAG: hypothetical protein J0H79_01365 [Alphaproteobacteria bacterium]|jgi:hypothetical protein|nr:hypothetical protein [Alphaproteobacteria bacterium]